VKSFLSALCILTLLMTMSPGAKARDPGDSPTPFPMGQAPEDFVGQWNNSRKNQMIVIVHIRAARSTEDEKLMATVYTNDRKDSQGYLMFHEDRFCGVMKKLVGGHYNLCVWKENEVLNTATYTDGEWGTFRRDR
jgi:hypothetical protein